MKMSSVSIILITYNKSIELSRTLDFLNKQETRKKNIEVIVVDDGSIDNTEQMVLYKEKDLRFSLKYVKIKRSNYNLSKVRNIGINKSLGELLIFLDAECIPNKNFISSHIKAHQENKIVAVGEVYAHERLPNEFSLFCKLDNFNDNTLEDIKNVNAFFDWRAVHYKEIYHKFHLFPAPWALLWGNNFSVKRELLFQAGLFDENFKGWASEDIELAYRFYKLGCKFIFLKEAYCVHQPHIRERQKQIINNVKNLKYFLSKCPTLEIEALCSFDSGNLNKILSYIYDFEKIATEKLNYPEYINQIQLEKLINKSHKTLAIGFNELSFLKSIKCQTAIDFRRKIINGVKKASNQIDLLHLIGINLPFINHTFDKAIISDIWRILPESLSARIMQECLRVAKEVYLLKSKKWVPDVKRNGFERILEQYYHPLWEGIIFIARKFSDFKFITLYDNENVTLFKIKTCNIRNMEEI